MFMMSRMNAWVVLIWAAGSSWTCVVSVWVKLCFGINKWTDFSVCCWKSTNRASLLIPKELLNINNKIENTSTKLTLFRGGVTQRHTDISFLKNSLPRLFVTHTRRDISYSIYKKIKISKRLWYKYIFFLYRKKPASSYKVGHQRMNNSKSSSQPSRVPCERLYLYIRVWGYFERSACAKHVKVT